MSTKNSSRKKAFLALAFASGSGNFFMPADAEDIVQTRQLVSKQLIQNRESPELKAFSALRMAEEYINADNAKPDDCFETFNGARVYSGRFRINDELDAWANRLSLELQPCALKETKNKSDGVGQTRIYSRIVEAADLAEQVEDPFLKQYLRYICSLLLLKVGNVEEFRKYDHNFELFFRSCEKEQKVQDSVIGCASSILNSMSYGILPVPIPEQDKKRIYPVRIMAKVTEQKFSASEGLRLRALAIADRLKPSSDVRRRAHRDMSLWYELSGNPGKAEEQKQILFELVGIHDDKILWPVNGACGALVWWVLEGRGLYAECGMG